MGPRREGLKFLHDPRKMTSKPLVLQNIPPSPPKPSLSLAKRHRAPDILIYDKKKKLAFTSTRIFFFKSQVLNMMH